MAANRKKRIPNPQPSISKTLISPSLPKELSGTLPINFDFKFLQTDSVKSGDFHNFCENQRKAIDQVRDLFYTMRILSQHKRGDLDQDRRFKDQMHWNCIDRTKPVERINRVLREAYRIPQDAIVEFENQYHEFSCTNGQRVICVTRDNVLIPLFLDPNHLICQENKASKNVQTKQTWSFPSLLHNDPNAIQDNSDKTDLTKDLIEEIMCGGFEDTASLQSFIQDLGLPPE